MIIKSNIPSWNKNTNKGCFGLGNPSNVDHIYPSSNGGSDNNINKQRLWKEANAAKKGLTKDKNGTDGRFSILKQSDSEGRAYRIMFIRHKDWENDVWKKVIPVL